MIKKFIVDIEDDEGFLHNESITIDTTKENEEEDLIEAVRELCKKLNFTWKSFDYREVETKF